MKKLLAVLVSDIHWQAGTARDDVTPAHSERMRSMWKGLREVVLRDKAYIVLVGDCWDGWRDSIGECVKAHWSDFAPMASTAARAGKQVFILLGNHDEDLEPEMFGEAPVRLVKDAVFNFGGKLVLVKHGHQWDPDPGLWRKAGIVGCKVLAWVGKYISHRLEDGINRTVSKLQAKGRYGTNEGYITKACADAKRMGCKVVVFGHTHEAGEGTHDGVKWVNTGTWKKNGFTLYWSDGNVTRF